MLQRLLNGHKRPRTRRRRPARLVLESHELEPRRLLAAISMTDQEQLLLELVNRARANPTAEAARYGIDLNQDLEPDEISAVPKQPLAPNQMLIDAARSHSDDMLAREFFEHENPDGLGPSDRARAAGYPAGAGENIAWYGEPGFLERDEEVYRRHEALFLSPPHRTNMMNSSYRELGNGVRYGEFSRRNSIMVTEDFGNRGGDYFITGVAYTDAKVADDFYTIGESLASVTVTASRSRDGQTFTTTTGPSGGYSLQVPAGVYTVAARGGGITGSMTVESVIMLRSNSKIDFNTRAPAIGSISGKLFDDADQNGVRDNQESLLAGRQVYLDADDDGQHDPDEPLATTDASGTYRFVNLRPASYRLRQELPQGWRETRPAEAPLQIELLARQNLTNADFGSVMTNAVPLAQGDAYSTETGRVVVMDVFANDHDSDGELVLELTQIHVPPEHGDVGLNKASGVLIYTPDKGYVGSDFFEYAVVDNAGLVSDPARVTITIAQGVGKSWQNPDDALDVNQNGVVSPLDSLLILNAINRDGAGPLSYPTADRAPPPYLDVTGDGFLSPLDALLVLNEVNRIAAERRRAATAEAEPSATDAVWQQWPASRDVAAAVALCPDLVCDVARRSASR